MATPGEAEQPRAGQPAGTERPGPPGGAGPRAQIPFDVFAVGREGEERLFHRPCVDCGLRTGCFCDACLGVERLPLEAWAPGQHTPLCTECDRRYNGLCHFCRGQSWATPPANGPGRPGGR